MQKTILSILVGLLFFMGPTGASGGGNKADVTGYCVKQFGATAFANIDRRDNGLLCSVRTDGGLGLTHNKVKAADICAKQYGTRRFRRDGQDVVCLKGAGDTAAQAGRGIDLEKYCRKAYGANAFPTVRRTDNAPMCSVRTDGGLGLRHYVIDTAGLCGYRPSRNDAKTLYCGGGEAGAGRPPSGEPLDAGGDGMLTGKAVTLADLEGCGGNVASKETSSKELTKMEYGMVSTPCPDLAGGRVATQADYSAYCQTFKEPGDEGMWALRHPDGLLPLCLPFPGPLPSSSSDIRQPGLRGTPASVFCLMLRFNILSGGDYNKAVREGGLSAVFKYDRKSRKLECFYLSNAQAMSLYRQSKKPKKDSGPAKPAASASSTDNKTGVTTKSVKNPDGTRTVTKTDKDGNVLSKETVGKSPASASATDTKTGITTKSVRNPDGTRTVTRTDKDGNVLSKETVGKSPDSASSTDTKTGITTKSVKNPDGTRTVTKTDKNGEVISRVIVDKSPASASSTDLRTKVTIKSVANPDGSRTVTTTDKNGKVLSRKRVR
ncbi:hypothetical protein BMS3Bbin10_01017 [bacterium BMS3Bbin10]|nr:hypothetical protein BMS3Bbin10_01017 [bacterium BMS3Bbin10]